MKKLTLALDLAGVVLLSAFAFAVWAPLALLTIGAGCLVASWSLSKNPPMPRVEPEERHPSTIPMGEGE